MIHEFILTRPDMIVASNIPQVKINRSCFFNTR